MSYNFDTERLRNKAYEEIKKRSSMQQHYHEYKRHFINIVGLESDEEMLTYEQYQYINEKCESDEY